MNDGDDGFLSRWSRRKVALRDGRDSPEPDSRPAVPQTRSPQQTASAVQASGPTAPPPADAAGPDLATDAEAAPAPEPAPSMEDVEALTPASDFARFTRADVDPTVRTAALKKLFADPRFNVIDEMDIDIMDYNKLEPLPANLLRRMTQAHALGLFRDEEKPPAATPSGLADASPIHQTEAVPETCTEAEPPVPPDTSPPADEDPDLRLQPDDAAGPPGDLPRTEDNAGRER